MCRSACPPETPQRFNGGVPKHRQKNTEKQIENVENPKLNKSAQKTIWGKKSTLIVIDSKETSRSTKKQAQLDTLSSKNIQNHPNNNWKKNHLNYWKKKKKKKKTIQSQPRLLPTSMCLDQQWLGFAHLLLTGQNVTCSVDRCLVRSFSLELLEGSSSLENTLKLQKSS